MDVDQSTLRFGSKGDEDSLMRCNRHGVDVNHDKKPDLVCWFDFTKSDFVPGDNQGVVTGSTNSGVDFEGKGVLKMVTGMPRPPHHDRDRDRDHGHRHRRCWDRPPASRVEAVVVTPKTAPGARVPSFGSPDPFERRLCTESAKAVPFWKRLTRPRSMR
jgi:hypothetical protein